VAWCGGERVKLTRLRLRLNSVSSDLIVKCNFVGLNGFPIIKTFQSQSPKNEPKQGPWNRGAGGGGGGGGHDPHFFGG
jgi:hypothetical protein